MATKPETFRRQAVRKCGEIEGILAKIKICAKDLRNTGDPARAKPYEELHPDILNLLQSILIRNYRGK